ncbi:MAG: hypothetical protein WDW36_009414 [Sanguina aurantia]
MASGGPFGSTGSGSSSTIESSNAPASAGEMGTGCSAYSNSTWLEELRVKDFALVSEQVVAFRPGFNVITGESGSGKSVLVEAFGQVLGSPAPSECVRTPAELASVEGVFVLSGGKVEAARLLLSREGLPQKALPSSSMDGTAVRLTVRREIIQSGGGTRSRCYINGTPTSLRVLRALGALLVDTNGQHAALSLREPATQLAMLDRLAGTAALVAAFGEALACLRAVEARLGELDELGDEGEREALQKVCDIECIVHAPVWRSSLPS